jgi:outer membrane protein assembly factor BamB
VTCGDTIRRSWEVVISVPASRERKRLVCRFNLHRVLIRHQFRPLHRRWWCAVIVVVLAIAGAGCSAAGHPDTASNAPTGSSRAAPSQLSSAQPLSTQFASAPGDGALVGLDARTGRQLWRTLVPMASVSAPVTGRGLVVVVGTRDCNDPHLSVVAVDATTGEPAWQRSVAVENPCGFGPAPLRLAGDVVVAGGPNAGGGGGLAHPGNACDQPVPARSTATGLDLVTGSPRWHAPATVGEVFAASPSIVIAASTSAGCFVGLNPATGQIGWTVAPPVIPFGLGISGNIAVGSGGDSATLGLAAIGLDCGTGQTRWKTALPTGQSGVYPLGVGDVVVASSGQGEGPFNFTLTALAPATGRRLWQQDSVQANDVRATIGPGIVLITRDNSPDRPTMEGRDPRTGARRWQSGDIGLIGQPVTDGATIVTFSQRDASGFGAADGHRLWTVPGSYQAAAVTANSVYLAQPKPPKNQPPQGD